MLENENVDVLTKSFANIKTVDKFVVQSVKSKTVTAFWNPIFLNIKIRIKNIRVNWRHEMKNVNEDIKVTKTKTYWDRNGQILFVMKTD